MPSARRPRPLAAAQRRGAAPAPALARGAGHARQDAREPDRHRARGARDREQARRRVRRHGRAPRRSLSSPRSCWRRPSSAVAHSPAARTSSRRLPPPRRQADARRMALAEARASVSDLERERRARTDRGTAIGIERERWTTRSAGAEQQIDALKARLAETRDRARRSRRPAGDDRGAARQADERAERGRAERQVAADALAEADTRCEPACRRCARRKAPSPKSARRARAPRRGWKARARAVRRGAPDPRDARHARRKAASRSPSCSRAPSCRRSPMSTASSPASRPTASGSAASTCRPTTSCRRSASQVDGLDTEKADVEEAIAKLRGAIGQLNREAQKRLQEAFETVNGHFQRCSRRCSAAARRGSR